MTTLVYNCPSGISGDMNLGAMVGLGVDPQALEAELRKLPYTGWDLNFENDQRQGIAGIRCTVHLEHDHSRDHSHSHSDNPTHTHTHRTFSDIRRAIENSALSEQVKADSIACFRALAEAEGSVHNMDFEKVHFHEVGAIDSIVDIVGAAICRDILGVERIVCQNLEVGGGRVRCAHGYMPVPAPATARLLNGAVFSAGATDQETTTPTGAALLVGRNCEFESRVQGTQLATAIGVGQRDDPKLPNVVYASLIDESSGPVNSADTIRELAVNLDDMTGEDIGFLCEQILEAGALDCWQVAAYFKKGRPGVIVHCLVEDARKAAVESTIFKHSLSLGVRCRQWERSKLAREESVIQSQFGAVRVKKSTQPDGTLRQKFEYDDCASIARKTGRPIGEIRDNLKDSNV